MLKTKTNTNKLFDQYVRYTRLDTLASIHKKTQSLSSPVFVFIYITTINTMVYQPTQHMPLGHYRHHENRI